MESRISLCATKDEQLAVLKAHLAVASREIALEENDLEGSRPYDRDRELGNAKQFLIECRAKMNGLTGTP
jgi:hypothetical protein